MPKKRHQQLFSKPLSTPPASLETNRRTSAQQDSGDTSPSVNQRLAELRRLNTSGSSSSPSAAGQSAASQPHSQPLPSVPLDIRNILDIPESPGPAPRPGRSRFALRGPRRPPPGPAAPRSWLAQSRHALRHLRLGPQEQADASQPDVSTLKSRRLHGMLPGSYLPEPGTLMDMVLRTMVNDWETHREYNQYYFSLLPGRLRATLIQYLGMHRTIGVAPADLRALFQPPPDHPVDGDDLSEDEGIELGLAPTPSLNEDVACLNLTGSVERFLKLYQLTDFLFPAASRTHETGALPDSWDSDSSSSNSPSIPLPLLPAMTQLSLALRPSSAPTFNTPWAPFTASPVSWKHLLALATHLPKLTHLSLAHWPTPALTPKAALTVVVDQRTGLRVNYSGTDSYSHSLDDDWSEALNVLRRLSTRLYGLEWLDLTGCSWAQALMKKEGSDFVDWAGAWGKVETLVLKTGVEVDWMAETGTTNRNGVEKQIALADSVAKHIVKQRAGRGKFITVIRDDSPPGFEAERRQATWMPDSRNGPYVEALIDTAHNGPVWIHN